MGVWKTAAPSGTKPPIRKMPRQVVASIRAGAIIAAVKAPPGTKQVSTVMIRKRHLAGA